MLSLWNVMDSRSLSFLLFKYTLSQCIISEGTRAQGNDTIISMVFVSFFVAKALSIAYWWMGQLHPYTIWRCWLNMTGVTRVSSIASFTQCSSPWLCGQPCLVLSSSMPDSTPAVTSRLSWQQFLMFTA